MSANMIQIDPTIQYPDQWTPMEYVCVCGKKCRVDVEFIPGPSSAQAYQHSCGQDDEHQMPGPIIASWEECEQGWILIGKYR